MSASINTSSYQSTQSPTTPILASGSTNISVTARIDYNLRFTKQAVLVIGKNTEQYSQLASQFLVSLSNVNPTVNHLASQDNHINVAFVAASVKLNDIQIRCRLIEQLFVNTLFDPEQSLAVSVLNFAKQHGEAISIVIDHAHALSLQVKYELCQLVSLSKKSKLTINVVLFGLTEAAQQLTMNKSLFKNKMAIIDAGSGQVISFDDKKILLKSSSNPLVLWQKLSLLGTILLIAGALIWVYLLIAEDVSKQAYRMKQPTVMVNSSKQFLSKTALVDSPSKKITREMQKKQKIIREENSPQVNETVVYFQATSEDINQALLSILSVSHIKKIPAKADDVLQALVTADKHINDNKTKTVIQGLVSKEKTTDITNSYYQTKANEYEKGYVVQIAGFSDEKLLQRFLAQHAAESFYNYQRLLKGKKFTVVTTNVFKNKTEAKASIALLPAQLIERRPWVKSISSVINEINTFKR